MVRRLVGPDLGDRALAEDAQKVLRVAPGDGLDVGELAVHPHQCRRVEDGFERGRGRRPVDALDFGTCGPTPRVSGGRLGEFADELEVNGVDLAPQTGLAQRRMVDEPSRRGHAHDHEGGDPRATAWKGRAQPPPRQKARRTGDDGEAPEPAEPVTGDPGDVERADGDGEVHDDAEQR